ncbi:helix-turn-helix domain-containing protein [Vibrio pectenicida]|uniref:Helix-turn-helix domain-containing protein n=1 Tax=Vibrio pectenicida TaxID=62763 RepID=A0A7Y4A2C3_9VIBR|nr:NadS family protein [Vibrio pectenicida]NOH73421.1 helix-turn-helix domain-containing protein [Vibrio pectenicida]
MSIFNELQASLEEAVDIQHGRKKPSKVTRYEVADVKAIREEVLKITQAELAATMDVSIDTIKSWESKRRNPSGLAAKVLATIQDDPKVYDALAAH